MDKIQLFSSKLDEFGVPTWRNHYVILIWFIVLFIPDSSKYHRPLPFGNLIYSLKPWPFSSFIYLLNMADFPVKVLVY
jgi:hypothetical protein